MKKGLVSLVEVSGFDQVEALTGCDCDSCDGSTCEGGMCDQEG